MCSGSIPWSIFTYINEKDSDHNSWELALYGCNSSREWIHLSVGSPLTQLQLWRDQTLWCRAQKDWFWTLLPIISPQIFLSHSETKALNLDTDNLKHFSCGFISRNKIECSLIESPWSVCKLILKESITPNQ